MRFQCFAMLVGLVGSVGLAHADPGDSAFRINPYLYIAKDHALKVGWAYNEDHSADRGAVRFFRGDRLVAEVPAAVTDDVQTVAFPGPSCGFGADARYQVQGMASPLPITEVPCPGAEAVRFSFLADTQEGPELARQFASEMKSFPGSLIFHGGDMVQTGADENDWTRYFWAMDPVGSARAMVPCVGNHEYRGNTRPLLWDKYFQTSSEEAFYATDAGPARIITLNSSFEDDPALLDKEVEFLSRELAAPAPWKIVVFHHPPYSWGIQHMDVPFIRKEHLKIRARLVPLFEQYKVDLVLNGHTHLFEYSEKDGVHYLTTGAAGGKMGMWGPTHTNPYTQRSEQTRTMVHVEATPTTLQAMSVDIDGRSLGTLTLHKLAH